MGAKGREHVRYLGKLSSESEKDISIKQNSAGYSSGIPLVCEAHHLVRGVQKAVVCAKAGKLCGGCRCVW